MFILKICGGATQTSHFPCDCRVHPFFFREVHKPTDFTLERVCRRNHPGGLDRNFENGSRQDVRRRH
jgi:hypothetical protein